jgi:hypothetical protein
MTLSVCSVSAGDNDTRQQRRSGVRPSLQLAGFAQERPRTPAPPSFCRKGSLARPTD